jgi:hypothetical protein
MGGACVPRALSLPANLAIELWIEARCAIWKEARGLRRAARVRREYMMDEFVVLNVGRAVES